jgi:hypothetical protein
MSGSRPPCFVLMPFGQKPDGAGGTLLLAAQLLRLLYAAVIPEPAPSRPAAMRQQVSP